MSIMGTRVIRTEDPRLLTSGGVYVDDLRTPELNAAARLTFVRSPVAHARITGIDTSEALGEPGVIAVLTVRDMDDLVPPPPSSGEWDGSPAPLGGPWAEPLLAVDTVRFVGEPVAVVITDGRYQGEDAADLVSVDYEPLPVVLGPTAAVADETLDGDVAGNDNDFLFDEFGEARAELFAQRRHHGRVEHLATKTVEAGFFIAANQQVDALHFGMPAEQEVEKNLAQESGRAGQHDGALAQHLFERRHRWRRMWLAVQFSVSVAIRHRQLPVAADASR